MAGDWIKMRSNLWDDPRVAKICDLTDCGEAAIVGGLYWLWATADQHSEDGIMPGLTLRSIDRKTGIAGFAAALVSIGWLGDHPEGVRIIHFEEHNGASAKARLMTAKRVAECKANAKVTVPPLPDQHQPVTDALPREEEEIEKNKKEPKSKTEAAPRGTRLASDWIAPAEYFDFCKTQRPDLDPAFMQEKFRDYWHPKAGKDAMKLDWFGTWRNFIRSERAPPARASPGTARAEKFDPSAYVNRNRTKVSDERTIEFNEHGEPV
jgi:hypothetical protein